MSERLLYFSLVKMPWRSLPTLIQRTSILALIFGVEALVASLFLDGENLPRQGILVSLLRDWGAWTVRWLVGFAALFTTFAWLRYRTALAGVSGALAQSPVRPVLLAAHFAAIAVFAGASAVLYGGGHGPLPLDALAALWGAAALAAMVSLALALIPGRLWVSLVRATGGLWLYCATAALLACSAGGLSQRLWGIAARSTFALVKAMVTLLVANPVVQPAALRIGTHRFTVVISPQCSGLEGVALLLVFGILWLTLFRKECRFPQALLLLPIGAAALFLLNAVRIATLVMIGHAGAPDIAAGGFHSQAGWMTFNSVAFGLSIAARRLSWFSVRPKEQEAAHAHANSTAVYLAPFLAILAAGMISRALTGGFEWLYSLRFVAALIALWMFRGSYADIPRRVSWFALPAGAAVFGIWIGLDAWTRSPGGGQSPSALTAAPQSAQVLWIVLRVLTAVTVVPIAEELAFRGFLFRRFISARFEEVSFQRFTWLALLGSSLIFGVLHGRRWLAGTLAGAIYALVSLRRGRLTDAMVAHGVTNALLAGWVLVCHRWDLW